MKKHIAEDLPARSHPQAQLSSQDKKPESRYSDGDKGGEKTPEQRIRQAVYDIRYRARRENIPLRSAYSQFMQNSSMSEQEKSQVRAKLFGKDGGMQAEDFAMDMKENASSAMAKALYKVFVEKNNEVLDIDEIKSQLKEASNSGTSDSKKYKVRVSDPQSNVTYVRYATREKISQLRARGLDVEMTEYGDPYEGERTKGEKTSEVLSRKARKDYDGDGKVESGAKEHAGAVHNAIQRKKGGVPDGKDTSSVKESFLGEISATANLPQTDSPAIIDPNQVQIDLLPANKKNKVTVNPTNTILAHNETGYSKFLNLLQEKKMTAAKKKKEKKLKAKYDNSGMKASMQQQYGTEKGNKVYFASIRKQAMKEESACEMGDKLKKKSEDEVGDSREIPTKVNLVKNKLRAMGLKMSYEPEGEVIDELNRFEKETGTSSGSINMPKGTPTQKGGKYAGDDPHSRGMRELMNSPKYKRPRQKKKEPGKKPPVPGEYDAPQSPAQKVAISRDRRRRAQEFMNDTRGT